MQWLQRGLNLGLFDYRKIVARLHQRMLPDIGFTSTTVSSKYFFFISGSQSRER